MKLITIGDMNISIYRTWNQMLKATRKNISITWNQMDI